MIICSFISVVNGFNKILIFVYQKKLNKIKERIEDSLIHCVIALNANIEK